MQPAHDIVAHGAAVDRLDLLDALLPSISVDGYEVLLDALMESGDRATRRKLSTGYAGRNSMSPR